MSASRMHPPARINTRWLKAAGLLLLLALVSLLISGVPILGPMSSVFVPDLLLAAAVFVVAFVARAVLGVGLASHAVLVLAIPVLALNTRLPVFVHDLALHFWSYERVLQKPRVTVGQPVALDFSGQALSGRRWPYAAASPDCRDQHCFTLGGFKTPDPDFERDYWKDSPPHAVRDVGLRVAKPQEPAHRLRITERSQGHIREVELELRDATGTKLAEARYYYRSGFWLEPADGTQARHINSSQAFPLLVNFLLHGSFVNAALGMMAPPGPAMPVGRFLKLALDVQAAGPASAGTVIEPEVLGQEVFDPPLQYMGKSGEYAKTPWTEKAVDAARALHCAQLLKREAPEDDRHGMVAGWWLFAQDPTATHRMQRSSQELCDADAVWALNYGLNRQQVAVKKYAATGELLWDVRVQRPAPVEGSDGRILAGTLHQKDGFVYFEWLNQDGSGWDLRVRRHMRLRFPVPPAGGPEAAPK